MGPLKGLLGVTGSRSRHFHIFPVLVTVLQSLRPSLRIFLDIENAGSMQPTQQAYILKALGLEPCNVKKIDAKQWSPARRNRLFIGSTRLACIPPTTHPPGARTGSLASTSQIISSCHGYARGGSMAEALSSTPVDNITPSIC